MRLGEFYYYSKLNITVPVNTTHRLTRPIILLVIATLFTGCNPWNRKTPTAGLEEIYAGAAKRKDIHRNAVIVIPGILGSRLVNEPTGQVAWGAFTRQAANPKKPESARVFALPMERGKPLNQLTDEVVPDGALDRLKVSLFSGFTVQPKAYLQILRVLGVGGFKDETILENKRKKLPFYDIDYGKDHYSCFQFAYDWRRSSAENAILLGEFVRKKKAYIEAENLEKYGTRGDVKFNFVSHSMGAMVMRYYLRYGEQGMPASGKPTLTWAGTKDVEKVIMVAPPNAGSVMMCDTQTAGLNLGPFTFKYPAAIVGTMPATYELLPRARHRPLKDAKTGAELDPLDPQVWTDYQWGLLDPDQDEALQVLLPNVSSREERAAIARDHLLKCLRNARNFQKAIDSDVNPPEHIEMILFAGDAIDTVVGAEAFTGGVNFTEYAPGDNTVARYSALMDERFGTRSTLAPFKSPLHWDQATFLYNTHLGLTQSRTFADNVLLQLLEEK